MRSVACLEAAEKRQMKGVHCAQPPAKKLPTNNDKDVATCDTAGYVWGCAGAWEKQGYLVITARPPSPWRTRLQSSGADTISIPRGSRYSRFSSLTTHTSLSACMLMVPITHPWSCSRLKIGIGHISLISNSFLKLVYALFDWNNFK